MSCFFTGRRKLSILTRLAFAVIAMASIVDLARSADADEFFTREVQPLLARHCFACHGPDEAEGGLVFHTPEALTIETDSGEKAIVPGKAEASEMIRRVTSTEDWEQMPPEGDRLTKDQVATLSQWINDGAKYESHWAFRPPNSPTPPAVSNRDWPRNEIDSFVLSRLERAGLSPAPKADPATLLRRLTHDLIGLPPKEEDVAAFVADPSDEAYAAAVDRLLATPHYGERWGRHWLDVVRFAESNSFERDNPKPNAWKFRDYVIDSLNKDKPFNRFLCEQLAGDELDDQSVETLTATGYLRLGIWDDEPADPLLNRFDQIDDLVSTTAQGMLGLSVGCARCHDHKIDPIPQRDYYELAAFFGGLTEYARRGDQMQAEWSQIDVSSQETLDDHAALDDEFRRLEKEMYELEQAAIQRMSAPDQRQSEGRGRKKLLKEKLAKFQTEEEASDYADLAEERRGLENERRQLPAREFVLGVAVANQDPPRMHIMQRGNPHAPADAVEPAYLDILGGGQPENITPTSKTTGRRRALAEWIASDDNPLTARVAVNRIWQHHFGRGIVRTPNNFGQLGAPPTHPELLDWLSLEFVRRKWSMKQIHRLIVTSAAYQMSTAFDEHAYSVDPGNELLWRRDMRRMDAEEVRDSILAVTGALNEAMGGPSVYPRVEDEIRQGLSRPDQGWPTTEGDAANRRSVYIFVKRSLVVPLLSAFDYPDPDSTCEARFKTTQPGQSLALLNSEFMHAQSKRLAQSIDLELESEPAGAFASAAFRRVLGRVPTEQEASQAGNLIANFSEDGDLQRGKELFCLLLLNTNEFLYIP